MVFLREVVTSVSIREIATALIPQPRSGNVILVCPLSSKRTLYHLYWFEKGVDY